MSGVALVIPMLNEAASLPRLLRSLSILEPAPDEIIVVDGGSKDDSVAIAQAGGLSVITAPRGRGAQINAGIAAVSVPLVCVLHADTLLPDDAMSVIATTMADPRMALASFLPLLSGPGGVRWGTSLHNWAKTYYGPLLFRPHLFLRGARLLFGDHAMFFRRADFLAAGGCDTGLPIMEDVDLCVRLHRFGRTRLVNRVVITSDRRVAAWGPVRANLIYLRVSASWAIGLRRGLDRHYPDVR